MGRKYKKKRGFGGENEKREVNVCAPLKRRGGLRELLLFVRRARTAVAAGREWI